MHFRTLLLLVCILAPTVHSQLQACDILPVPGCTCWKQFADITVSCNSLDLMFVPGLSDSDSVLSKLELAYNNLGSLLSIDFGGTTTRHLDISHNRLTDLDIPALSHMYASLESIDFSYNRLVTLPSFKRFSALNSIDVSHNHITTPFYSLMDNLPSSMRHVDLTFNPIPSLSVSTDSQLYSLSSLSLGPASDRIDLDDLFGQSSLNLRRLRLVGSKLEVPREDGHDFIGTLTKLEELDVENCSIADTPDFRYVLEAVSAHLRVLSLPHNAIESIGDLQLPVFARLTTLNLSYNKLTWIKTLHMRHLSGIRYLYLQHNLIERITPTAISAMKRLRFVDLSHNSLQHLSRSTFTPSHLLSVTVLLSNNPWRCDCALRWLLEAARHELEGQPGPVQAYELHNALECESPPAYAGVSFLQLATDLYPEYTGLCY